MKPLTQAIHDYLALRRSLGFKLRDAGMTLAKFATFILFSSLTPLRGVLQSRVGLAAADKFSAQPQ